LLIPEHGSYLWGWYEQISNSCVRIVDGICRPIPPSEILAWIQLTGNIVWPSEYAILVKMDRAYCEEMNLELEANRARRDEQLKQQQDKSRKGRK